MNTKKQLERYHTLRANFIKKLGGKCVLCKSTEKLEIDHIDAKTKKVNVAKIFNLSEKRIWEEIKKCQILCRKCHMNKSITEKGKRPAKGTHGTLSAYKYCRCLLCKQAKAKWFREYRKKKKQNEEKQ